MSATYNVHQVRISESDRTSTEVAPSGKRPLRVLIDITMPTDVVDPNRIGQEVIAVLEGGRSNGDSNIWNQMDYQHFVSEIGVAPVQSPDPHVVIVDCRDSYTNASEHRYFGPFADPAQAVTDLPRIVQGVIDEMARVSVDGFYDSEDQIVRPYYAIRVQPLTSLA